MNLYLEDFFVKSRLSLYEENINDIKMPDTNMTHKEKVRMCSSGVHDECNDYPIDTIC